MHHGPAAELGVDNAIAQKNKLGILLFVIYMIVYGGFVLIGTVKPKLLGEKIFGQNISVIYGLGLILLAAIMGAIYHIACSRYEKKLNQEGAE